MSSVVFRFWCRNSNFDTVGWAFRVVSNSRFSPNTLDQGLVANGDNDRMVPTRNTYDLAKRLPNSELVIYSDSGHGAVFQFHEQFVSKALEFLER